MRFQIPTDPDTLLSRAQTAAALTNSGFPIAEATLATRATRGGGPPYQLFGPRVLYRWGEALSWARSRLTAPRRSTSEGDALEGHAKIELYGSEAQAQRVPQGALGDDA
jgi:hypothetical protein